MVKKFTFLVLTALSLVLSAQQKPVHEKQVYLSQEGKLYVNKELPLYLWLSTSPDESSKKYRLKSEETPQYSNPMYFDTEGYNTFRSPSAVDPETRKTVYPVRDIVFEVYSDGVAPVTAIHYGDSKPYKYEGKLFVMANTKLELNAKDALSGLQAIYYSIDGGAYTKYTQPLSFTEEKEYTLKYYSVDNVGNSEEVKEVKYMYDKTSPVTTRKISKDEHTNVISARSKVELSAEDKGIGVSKILYKIDEGSVRTYKYPINAANLSQGEHTITYYAIDKVGNKESEKTYSVYVDKKPPTIIEEIIAKTFFANGKEYASGKSQLKLTAFDNKAGVKEIRYSINGGEYKLYDKPVFLTSSSGNLDIKAYAVDNVNNRSVSQATNEKTSIPYIDLSGPGLKQNFVGPVFGTRDTIFISAKTKIQLKAYDKEAGINRIEYTVDSKEMLTYEKPFSILEEGVHTINYTGYDNVENSNSNSFFVKVDNTGPDINYKFSTPVVDKANGKNTYPKYVILFLSGTDSVVGLENIKYGFSSAEPTKIYASPITGFSTGEKNVKVVAKDKLGNKTEKVINFNVKD